MSEGETGGGSMGGNGERKRREERRREGVWEGRREAGKGGGREYEMKERRETVGGRELKRNEREERRKM